jgi:hypothetical protein
MDEAVVDGNAVAGTMYALFGREMTIVQGRCGNCGRVHMIGAMRAYLRAPGTVLRCPTCEHVVLRVVETPTATLIDLRGARFLRLERVDGSSAPG